MSKLNWFISTTLHDWLKRLAPIFHPIKSETKSKHCSFAQAFPRFASAACNFFAFWLVHCIAGALAVIGWSDYFASGLYGWSYQVIVLRSHLTRTALQHEYLNHWDGGCDSYCFPFFSRHFSTDHPVSWCLFRLELPSYIINVQINLAPRFFSLQ